MRDWMRIIWFGCWILTACFVVTSFLLVAPLLEYQLFGPVVSKLHIDSTFPRGLDQTEVYASFRKLRDCEYKGIAWYRGNRDTGFVRVPIALLRKEGDMSSPNRPVGYQSTGPWIVSMPVNEIAGNSFVELFHQCTWLWVTKTDFYP